MPEYTLCFICCEATREVLMLNRNRPPWMGNWNGVGGKLKTGEKAIECVAREVFEETGLSFEEDEFTDRGLLIWENDAENMNKGVEIYTVNVSKCRRIAYQTPKYHCDEGLLDWKPIAWVSSMENTGVVDNLPYIFQFLFASSSRTLFSTKYEGNHMVSFELKNKSSSD